MTIGGFVIGFFSFFMPSLNYQQSPAMDINLRGRLISRAGSVSYSMTIEIRRLSELAELEELRLCRERDDQPAFKSFFEAKTVGRISVLGEGMKTAFPIHAAVKKRAEAGWQLILAARNLVIEPGVRRGIDRETRSGGPTRSRFLAIILDLDERYSGGGRVYENADLTFETDGIEVSASSSIPLEIVGIKTKAIPRAGPPNKAVTTQVRTTITDSLREAVAAIRKEETSLSPMIHSEGEITLDMDSGRFQEAARKISLIAAKEKLSNRLMIAWAYALYRGGRIEDPLALLADPIRDEDLRAFPLFICAQIREGRREEAEGSAKAFQARLSNWLVDENHPSEEEAALIREILPQAGIPAYVLGLKSIREADYESAPRWLALAHRFGYDPLDCWIQIVFLAFKRESWAEVVALTGKDGFVPGDALSTESPVLRPGIMRDAARIPAEIWLMRGMALERLAAPSDALAALEEAERRKPYDPEVIKVLAAQYWITGQPTAALALWRRGAALDPHDTLVQDLVEMASASTVKRDITASLPLPDDFMMDRDARYVHVFHNDAAKIADEVNRSAISMIREGKDGAAWLQLTSFAEIYRLSPTIYYNIALLAKNRGLYGEALRWASKAVELKSDYKEGHDLIGNVLYHLGDFGASIRSYNRALQIDSADPLSHFNLGCAFEGLRDNESAERSWREAVRVDGRPRPLKDEDHSEATRISLEVNVESVSAMSYRSLAYLMLKQGRRDEAQAMFLAAIAANPRMPEPYWEVGRLWQERKNPVKAKLYFDKYIALGGDAARVKAQRSDQSSRRSSW